MGKCARQHLRSPYFRRCLRSRCDRIAASAPAGAEGSRPRHRLLDGFRLPVPAGAAPAVHRLPGQRQRARRSLLRPSRRGSTAHQSVCHRQGRLADGALVQARPSDRADRRARRADLLVGLDVRVSYAAAGDAGTAGRHPQPDQQSDCEGADQPRPPSGHALGHFGSRVQRARPRAHLPVHQLRRADARAQARPRPERRHRALRLDPRLHVRSEIGARQPRTSARGRRTRCLRLP
ncbi:hypothetical protein D9M72_371130 [compost metagenome]